MSPKEDQIRAVVSQQAADWVVTNQDGMPDEMQRAHHDEIVIVVIEQVYELRHPGAVAVLGERPVEFRESLVFLGQGLRERVDVAAAPGCEQLVDLGVEFRGLLERHQQ